MPHHLLLRMGLLPMQMPYLNFLWKIHQTCPTNPMIFLDIPHVALRPFHRAKNIDSLMSACNEILSLHGLNSASFIGHSFGSLCISRMCQVFPEAVDSIVSLPSIQSLSEMHSRRLCEEPIIFAILELCFVLQMSRSMRRRSCKCLFQSMIPIIGYS